jgi:serine/threonine protein phosphatase PrpC
MGQKTAQPAQPRPLTSELDVVGMTHKGKVRAVNADHFLVGSFHRTLRVHSTSVPAADLGSKESESRGFFGIVADGVGSLAGSEESSAKVLDLVSQHLLHASEICSSMAIEDRDEAIAELKKAVSLAHKALRDNAEQEGLPPTATTFTMWAAFWPLGFAVNVGDSRIYRLCGDKFERLTTDQTMAQMMVEAGAMTAREAEGSNLKNVLWSALGASEAVPDVSVHSLDARDRVLVCSDGLTKHVTDDEIRDHLARSTSAEKTCRELIDLTLERGATDNVTVVVGKARGR